MPLFLWLFLVFDVFVVTSAVLVEVAHWLVPDVPRSTLALTCGLGGLTAVLMFCFDLLLGWTREL
jgi:hypothetical protein